MIRSLASMTALHISNLVYSQRKLKVPNWEAYIFPLNSLRSYEFDLLSKVSTVYVKLIWAIVVRGRHWSFV